MSDKNLEKKIKMTYLKMIENSPGTKMFNSLFVTDKTTARTYDVLNDGDTSCAFYVSSVLNLMGLLDSPHATVATVVSKLGENERWSEVDHSELEPGDVVIWETVTFDDGSQNEHIGFCLDSNTAVSTSSKEKQVTRHSIDFDGNRMIIKALRPNL